MGSNVCGLGKWQKKEKSKLRQILQFWPPLSDFTHLVVLVKRVQKIQSKSERTKIQTKISKTNQQSAMKEFTCFCNLTKQDRVVWNFGQNPALDPYYVYNYIQYAID